MYNTELQLYWNITAKNLFHSAVQGNFYMKKIDSTKIWQNPQNESLQNWAQIQLFLTIVLWGSHGRLAYWINVVTLIKNKAFTYLQEFVQYSSFLSQSLPADLLKHWHTDLTQRLLNRVSITLVTIKVCFLL